MIHQYKLGGYNVVLDVCSGSVHVVDEVAYDIIGVFEEKSKDEILTMLEEKYPHVIFPTPTYKLSSTHIFFAPYLLLF